jgi:hypothetical protein
MKEFITPGGRKYYGGPRRVFWRRAYYPYGMWTCSDGRQVLFNRHYEPIWERKCESAPAERADPKEWVKFSGQEWFYNSSGSEKDWRRSGAKVLSAWGIQLPGAYSCRRRHGRFSPGTSPECRDSASEQLNCERNGPPPEGPAGGPGLTRKEHVA